MKDFKMLNGLLSCNFMLLGDPSDALVDDDIQGENWLSLVLLLLVCEYSVCCLH